MIPCILENSLASVCWEPYKNEFGRYSIFLSSLFESYTVTQRVRNSRIIHFLPILALPSFSYTHQLTCQPDLKRSFFPMLSPKEITDMLNMAACSSPQKPAPLQNPAKINVSTSRISNPQRFSRSCLTINRPHVLQAAPSVSQKVQSLDFEFKTLPEPIDRVRRLLEYAAVLPAFDGCLRSEQNRVTGCTAQVWLEVRMDEDGAMRFRVDSDSEITKGFCSCLIWLLDGAGAEDVLSVKIDDLAEMNVGLPSRGNSRVNTWHNVLVSMQKRTKDLVLTRARSDCQSLEDLSSSLIAVNGSSD